MHIYAQLYAPRGLELVDAIETAVYGRAHIFLIYR